MADERGDVEVESKRATYEEGKQYFLENRQSSVDTLRIDNPVLYQRGQDLELIDDWNVFANSPSQRGSTDKELFFRLSKTNGDGLFQMKRNDFVELMSRRMNDADFKVAIGLYNRANQFDDSNLTSEVSTEDIIQEIARDRELLDRGGPGSSLKLQGATYYNFRVAALNSIRSFEVAELQGRRKSTAEEQRQQVLKVANEKFFSNIGAPDPLLPLAAMSELQKTGLTEAERREFGASGESPGRRGAFLNADLMTQYWQENNPPGTPVPPAITNSDDVYLGEIPPSASRLITAKLIEDGTPVTPTAILVRWVQSRGNRR